MPSTETGGVPCGLVVMGSGDPPSPESAVFVFTSAKEADAFARRHQLDEWVVVPVLFAVDMDRSR